MGTAMSRKLLMILMKRCSIPNHRLFQDHRFLDDLLGWFDTWWRPSV
jgi:hypothetical protein